MNKRCQIASILNRLMVGFAAVLAGVCLASCGENSTPPANTAAVAEPMLVLYAALPAERIARVATRYREETGVLVNYMLETDETLIDKLIRKEHRPGADVLLISGAGHLAQAVDSDVLRPVSSAVLTESLADTMRDPDGYWFGLGHRAELIVYDRRQVAAGSLGSYADLADETWRGKLCLHRGARERSRSLVAALIATLGERDAELVVRGWRANLATGVFDEQRELLLAIESGDCVVGIVSSDEVGFLANDGQIENTGHHFPSATAGGTLQQVIAAGVSRHANDAELATRFVEWLASPDGQAVLHEDGTDYPLAGGRLPPPLDTWPDYSPSPITASRSGFLHRDAQRLIERARYR